MKEMFLWEVEYKAMAVFESEREIKVLTEKDSYGEAERVAISAIKGKLKDSSFKFLYLTNINPSVTVYVENPIEG